MREDHDSRITPETGYVSPALSMESQGNDAMTMLLSYGISPAEYDAWKPVLNYWQLEKKHLLGVIRCLKACRIPADEFCNVKTLYELRLRPLTFPENPQDLDTVMSDLAAMKTYERDIPDDHF